MRRLELALFLKCSLSRSSDTQNQPSVTLAGLMSGNPASSAARLVAEYQLYSGHDTEDTSGIRSLCTKLAQSRSNHRDLQAIKVITSAATFRLVLLGGWQKCWWHFEQPKSSFLLEKIESGGLLAVELQLQNFVRTPDSDSKQTGNRNDLLGSLSVEWKWFGEEDVQTDASNHPPSSMIALLDRMTCEGEEKGTEKCWIILNTVACVLPHVVYDFDCIAAHRIALAERCKVKVYLV